MSKEVNSFDDFLFFDFKKLIKAFEKNLIAGNRAIPIIILYGEKAMVELKKSPKRPIHTS